MTKQLSALWIADELDKSVLRLHAEAAAELRRLQQIAEDTKALARYAAALEQTRKELLGAVKKMMRYMDEDCGDPDCAECKHYRPVWAAIAKAEGETK